MNGLEKFALLALLAVAILAVNVGRFAAGQYTKMTGIANFPRWFERLLRPQGAR
jgi:hypothetical protein